MKVIKTLNFTKMAANWDDQPNFHTPRYQKEQGQYMYYSGGDGSPDNEDDIEKKWGKDKPKKKKKRRKKKNKD